MNSQLERVHVMVDLETLGTTPGSVITSIGAVVFDPENTGRVIRDRFHIRADLDDAVSYGKVSGSTLRFWFNQTVEAQQEVLGDRQTNALAFVEMLRRFTEFLRDVKATNMAADVCLWGNSARFDLGLLAYFYEDAECLNYSGVPWKFWHELDCRTIMWLATKVMGMERPVKAKDMIEHNPLEDAKFQATWVEVFVHEMGIAYTEFASQRS